MAQFGVKSIAKLEGVHPDLVKVMMEAIKDTPIDFTIFSGVRTLSEQQGLYALGRTNINPDGKNKNKPRGNIVTKADGVRIKSNHQVKSDGNGHAVDLYAYINGSIKFNDVISLKIIAAHILKTASDLCIVIEWGGNWKFTDYPHFQLKS